jgi:hypothetical protein
MKVVGGLENSWVARYVTGHMIQDSYKSNQKANTEQQRTDWWIIAENRQGQEWSGEKEFADSNKGPRLPERYNLQRPRTFAPRLW